MSRLLILTILVMASCGTPNNYIRPTPPELTPPILGNRCVLGWVSLENGNPTPLLRCHVYNYSTGERLSNPVEIDIIPHSVYYALHPQTLHRIVEYIVKQVEVTPLLNDCVREVMDDGLPWTVDESLTVLEGCMEELEDQWASS